MHSFFVAFLCRLLHHVIASNATNSTGYWFENIKHQGLAPFSPNASTYQVFRNVKDFGAKGDGITDDTFSINLAMSSGGRCAPGSCNSSTTTPAVVYFPAGTYLLSASIIDYYFTQIIGDPNSLPVLKATSNFSAANSLGLIDGDRYGADGLQFGPTNVFYRQIRNFVFDLTKIPPSVGVTALHWPTSQATSLQNIVFRMSDAVGTQHQGIVTEAGSGGFMTDLVFHGGLNGVVFANQQFTTRNLTFNNAVTAISQSFDWGWTYSGVVINNCSVGLNMSSGGSASQAVGSVTFFDSSIINTPIGILSAHNASSLPPAAGSLILENVLLKNVAIGVQGPNNSTVLRGTNGTRTISGWGQGHSYTPNGRKNFEGPISPNSRPNSLLEGKSFYTRSKPQYKNVPLSRFCSVRSEGAFGDGKHDDTKALQSIILRAAKENKIVFFDFGIYKVSKTIYIPPNSKIVGETYPVILGSGPFFSNIQAPRPVVQVGGRFERGSIEWSDMVISTRGNTSGAVLIQWNLASPSAAPSGMWDVHARVGGFAGSKLQVAQCEKTPELGLVNPDCIAAFMTMHVTKTAAGLYVENVWLWVADHDIEDPLETQITIYNGRGLYVESQAGNIWLVGTAVEHHQLYQYQFANTKDVFMGQIQTETAYYQPAPNALLPFTPVPSLNDPDFYISCLALPGNCDGWGLRIIDSDDILVYGGGLYSFFDNYNTTCSDAGNGEVCQNQIFSIEGSHISNVNVYNLNTIGATNMITRNGRNVATSATNSNSFTSLIALFRSG